MALPNPSSQNMPALCPVASEGVDDFVARHLRRNFTALALDYGFFGLGMSFASTSTILPALAERLGAPNLVIGAMPSIVLLGRSVPAVFSSRVIQPLPRKLPYVLTYTVWERLPWLALALGVLALGESNPDLVVALLAGTLAVAALVGGWLSPAWLDLVGKVIPTAFRGRFFAVGSAFATGLGLGGAIASGYFLREFPFPLGYSLCLGAAFACLVASWGSMTAAREPATGGAEAPLGLAEHLGRLPGILRSNPSFAWYLGAQGFRVIGLMAVGFYTVHALRSLGAEEWNAAGFTFALLAAQALGGLQLGWLGDRLGHRASLLLGAVCAAGAGALAAVLTDLLAYHTVFVLAGLGIASTNISSQNLVMELAGEEEQRPVYLGLASTSHTPFALLAPLLGGALADGLGLRAVFVVAAAVNALGAATYWLKVVEPRRTS